MVDENDVIISWPLHERAEISIVSTHRARAHTHDRTHKRMNGIDIFIAKIFFVLEVHKCSAHNAPHTLFLERESEQDDDDYYYPSCIYHAIRPFIIINSTKCKRI